MDTKTAAEITARPEYRTDEEIRTAYHVLCKSKAAFAAFAADKLEQFAERRGIELTDAATYAETDLEYPTIAAAAAALLDQYDGGDAWQDIVSNLPGYDAEMTDRIDPGMRSDRVAFEDGTVIRFEPSLGRWIVADRTASEIAADLA